MIFAELKKFVVAALGGDAWNTLVGAAGVAGKVYLPNQTYDDRELIALVAAASRHTGKPAAELVEAFGTFIVPGLVRAYGAHINPGWKTLDLLENTEETIHRVVRTSQPGATPPRLTARRSGRSEVTIEYASQRKLCSLATGIVRGIADHYQEKVEISQTSCMLHDAPKCTIRVALLEGRQ
jgi:hypothetical protein